MRKILIFTVLLSVLVGVAVFAAGGQEEEYGNGPRYEDRWEEFSSEIITLTGRLVLDGEWRPELETAEGTYELMYPPFVDDGLEVKDGDKITVEGFLVPGPRWVSGDERSEERYLHVTKAVIDGKEYIVAHPGRGRKSAGRGNFGGRGCWRDGGRRDFRGYGRR